MDEREKRAGNLLSEIVKCETHKDLSATAAVAVGYYHSELISREQYATIVKAGKQRRKELSQ